MLHRRSGQARLLSVLGERGQLAARRHVVLWPDHQADPLVAEGGQVPERLARRGVVVGRHAGKLQAVDGSVDQNDRDPAAAQQAVVVMRRSKLVVLAADEYHPGRVLVEQQVDVVGLGQPSGRLGA